MHFARQVSNKQLGCCHKFPLQMISVPTGAITLTRKYASQAILPHHPSTAGPQLQEPTANAAEERWKERLLSTRTTRGRSVSIPNLVSPDKGTPRFVKHALKRHCLAETEEDHLELPPKLEPQPILFQNSRGTD